MNEILPFFLSFLRNRASVSFLVLLFPTLRQFVALFQNHLFVYDVPLFRELCQEVTMQKRERDREREKEKEKERKREKNDIIYLFFIQFDLILLINFYSFLLALFIYLFLSLFIYLFISFF